MQLELSEEERAFRDEMREFFTTKVDGGDPHSGSPQGRELTKDQIVESMRTLNAAGLAVPRWPVEHGGQDWTEIQFHIWHEEMERAFVPTPLAFNAGMIGPVIAQFGTEEQKKEFLPKTANIDIFWSQGFSEPDAGSDLAGLRTHRRQGRRRLGRQRPEDVDHARASTATGSSRWCAPTRTPRSRPASRCC